jgi:hypothetical protein
VGCGGPSGLCIRVIPLQLPPSWRSYERSVGASRGEHTNFSFSNILIIGILKTLYFQQISLENAPKVFIYAELMQEEYEKLKK